MTTTNRSCLLVLLLGIFTQAGSGCAYMAGAAPEVEADFGNSVRNMVSKQTYNPAAADNPQEDITEGLDGNKAALGLKTYRMEAGTGASVQKPITNVMD